MQSKLGSKVGSMNEKGKGKKICPTRRDELLSFCAKREEEKGKSVFL